MSDEQRKILENIDQEVARSAPTFSAFIFALVTKYGILGLVVVFLGWQWTEKDSQQQKNFEEMVRIVKLNTEQVAVSNEINRRVLLFLETHEKAK